MKIPKIIGTIDRRILINYQVEKEVVAAFLPAPFRPKLVQGKAVVGICLIRLKGIRPKGLPKAVGISSENGAHRIAVEWTENGQTKEGVFIPRRDTSSKLNSLAGGRVFPGVHHLANFSVEESAGSYKVSFLSDDSTALSIEACETDEWNKESIFEDLECASEFFKQGSVGYSPGNAGDEYDGLELIKQEWKVKPLAVSRVESSFFENENVFPKGSVKFDNALLMRSVEHEWKSLKEIRNT